jgi:hypothetical protein
MSGSEQAPEAVGAEALHGDAGRDARRRDRRRWVVPVLLAAVLVPYTITGLTFWWSTGDDATFAQRERNGIVALGPITRLMAVTADAQSAAVAGHTIDVATLQAQMKAVDAADAQVGAGLGSSSRWADVRSRLGELITASPTGTAGYTAFSQVLDLQAALVSAVADSSNLILDPKLDSYYLMDTTVLQVPNLIVNAGRAADLTLLSEQHKALGRNDALDAAVGAVAVQESSAAIDSGLRKAFAATTSTTVGPAMLSQLDQLREAVTTLAPPTAAVGAAPTTRSAVELQAARVQLRDAALRVDAAGLSQLDRLVSGRLDGVNGTRRLVLLVTLAGLLIAVGVAWVAGPRRRTESAGDLAGGTAGHVTEPSADPAAGTQLEPGDDPDLLEARDLLQARHLVRVGRAVSPSREKR